MGKGLMGSDSFAALTLLVRGILFDMDGVLISSIAADERSWLRWARFHHMEETFSLQSTHGRRTIDTIRAARPDLDLAVEVNRMEAFDAEEQGGVLALPGAKSLVAGLPAGAWTVVTSASERMMRQRLALVGMEAPPNAVSADHVAHGKPHPEPYERGARMLGLAPSECLVIEDAPAGVRAGKAAGCAVLAVLTSHGAEELEEADWIVPSLEGVTAMRSLDGRVEVRLSVLAGGQLSVPPRF
jgi:sugar-phosphatase